MKTDDLKSLENKGFPACWMGEDESGNEKIFTMIIDKNR